MARYSPEFVARVQRDYEDTDIPLPALAAKYETYVRTIQRWASERGWKRRSERPPRELPQAVRLLDEATALLAGPEAASETGPSSFPHFASLHAGYRPAGDGERSANAKVEEATGSDASAAIERIERLVEQELAAEEAVRAQLGALPRNAVDAQRCARTLSTLTQTLHAVQRLRCGLAPTIAENHDDDLPDDIDEFRRDLARRIDAFVASRTQRSDGDGDPSPREMERIR